MNSKNQLTHYRNSVLNPYQIYNSLFLNLPFDAVHSTGMLLPLLYQACEAGYQRQQSPHEILTAFLQKHSSADDDDEKITWLFQFIQYIERQIVLFDSVEEAAYTTNHDLDGLGTIPFLANQAAYGEQQEALKKRLQSHAVRVVLTAHPTQFYPGPVLGIMTDLSQSIQDKDITFIEQLLKQLGKTPLFKKEKPAPFDEALSLIWYLENVFYDTVRTINDRIKHHIFSDDELPDHPIIELGFWPGGDRDGNPFVNAETTLKVAQRLKQSVLKCYYRDVRKLKRRLTFEGVDVALEHIEKQLYQSAYVDLAGSTITADKLLDELVALRQMLLEKHQGLFVQQVNELISQLKTFGLYFATLDIRQDSRVHHQVMCEVAQLDSVLAVDYAALEEPQQRQALLNIIGPIEAEQLQSEVGQDTLKSIQAIAHIQQNNGEAGANRYIISNCQSALNVMEVLAFFKLAGWQKNQISVDVVPLFETIEDLHNAPEIMQVLYQDASYQQHLKNRNQQQTIMLGFSDGTKDGGYLAANWAIVKAKEQLSQQATEYDIKVVFFDGRGGPPARGGGEAHKFYATQSPLIAPTDTQLTIQGQTISSNFGNQQSAQYNLEQLLSAGLSNGLLHPTRGWDNDSKQLLQQMADISLTHYTAFKQHPQFIPYLEQVSTLKYYGKTNIGSRPTKRSGDGSLVFADLRAIPFVGAWSQLKQNVLGYYGLGEALKQMIAQGKLARLQQLYQDSGYFKALIDNSMMSICKSYMPLTAYLQNDPQFGEFWLNIFAEFNAAIDGLKAVAQVDTLLADNPLRKQSIQTREAIVLPLLTIQQYCLQQINILKQQDEVDERLIAVYEKLVTRSLYGNINASRNSV